MKKFCYVLSIFLFLVGCSSQKLNHQKQELKHSTSAKPPVSTEGMTWQQASKKLDDLVKEAMSSGDEAVTYLASDLYLKATDASLRGDVQTSGFLYEYVIKLKPDDDYIKKRYSVELIRLNKLDQARDMLVGVYHRDPRDEMTGLLLAGVYTAQENKEEARKIYHTVLKHHPGSEEACIFLSKSYAAQKKFKNAFGVIDQCQKKASQRAIFSYYRGKLELDRGRIKVAEKHFKKALKIDPEYYQAVLAIGLLAEEKQDFIGAIKVYKKYLETEPDNFTILSRLVHLMFAESKYNEVLPYAEQLSGIDPSDLNLKVRLGILYADVKKFKKAIATFNQIIELVPNSDKAWYYLGSLYQQTESYEKAIEAFGAIKSESQLFLDSHIQIAQIMQSMAIEDYKKKENKNVERFFDFTNELSRAHPKTQVRVGIIISSYYEAIDRVPMAIESLEPVRRREDFTDAHTYYLASLYEKIQRYEESRGLVREILERDPKNAHALNFLGYSLLETGEDMADAYRLIKSAVKLKPDDGYILDSLAWYYYKTGKFNKALQHIKKAVELVKNDVVITKHLAMIYQSMKKYELAKQHYMEALSYCKLESERRDVLQSLEKLEKVRLPASQ